MQEYELIKQTGDPSGESRKLWEAIFSEDTKEFLDYYYQYKVPEAQFYLLKDGEQLISMLHLNPYAVYCNGVIRKAYYIVAVATKLEYRHRGCMRRLLQEAISDATKEKCPFLFLMPADPAIYEPFGFRYVYDHRSYEPATEAIAERIREAAGSGKPTEIGHYRICRYESDKAKEVTAFAGKELSGHYRTFCIHDTAYMERLQKELQSENGDLFLVYDLQKTKECFTGYFCYAKEETESYQEVVLTAGAKALFVPQTEKKAIMALPIDLIPKPCYFPELV